MLGWAPRSSRRRARLSALALAVTAATATAVTTLAVAPGARAAGSATSYTWSGADHTGTWSDAANWSGASAPSGSIGALTFPALTCSPVVVCTAQVNVDGVNATSLTIDDATGYSILPASSSDAGEDLVLGSGGLTAATDASGAPSGTPALGPIDFQGQQTWTIDGGPAGVGALSIGKLTGRSTGGMISTAPPALTVDLADSGTLTLPGGGVDNEPATLTLVGANTADTGAAATQNGTLTFSSAAAKLGSGSQSPITVQDAGLLGGGTFGPLTVSGGLAGFRASPGTIQVNGAATLNSGSLLDLPIVASGTAAGTSFAQFNTGTTLNLGGASLSVFPRPASSTCPSLKSGDVDTLVTATIGINGTFAGLPNGAQVTFACAGTAPTVQINYTATTVTATVVHDGGPGYATVTQLTSSAASASAGANVQFVAGVSAAATGTSGTPVGSVRFSDDGAAIAGCGAVPVSTAGSGGVAAADCTAPMSAGSHSVSAVYTPSSASWAGSASGAVAVSVSAASTSGATGTNATTNPTGTGAATTMTLAAAPDRRDPQELDFNAAVTAKSATPVGTVSFYDGTIAVPGCTGLALSAGRVSCSSGLQTTGSQAITAVYAPAAGAAFAAAVARATVTSTLSVTGVSLTHLNASPALGLGLRSARAPITGVSLQFLSPGISFTPGAAFMTASGPLRLRHGVLSMSLKQPATRASLHLGTGAMKLAKGFSRSGTVEVLATVSFSHGPQAQLLLSLAAS